MHTRIDQHIHFSIGPGIKNLERLILQQLARFSQLDPGRCTRSRRQRGYTRWYTN
ncbi:MAG: hypothetical protein KDD19_18145 [Phaeodactylibacter sp.]|nr:hypothetical protein [Phaeodactylibacter sp.]MCB9052837.1 hypothetical protein [Lewinellaceae bacterium]